MKSIGQQMILPGRANRLVRLTHAQLDARCMPVEVQCHAESTRKGYPGNLVRRDTCYNFCLLRKMKLRSISRNLNKGHQRVLWQSLVEHTIFTLGIRLNNIRRKILQKNSDNNNQDATVLRVRQKIVSNEEGIKLINILSVGIEIERELDVKSTYFKSWLDACDYTAIIFPRPIRIIKSVSHFIRRNLRQSNEECRVQQIFVNLN